MLGLYLYTVQVEFKATFEGIKRRRNRPSLISRGEIIIVSERINRKRLLFFIQAYSLLLNFGFDNALGSLGYQDRLLLYAIRAHTQTYEQGLLIRLLSRSLREGRQSRYGLAVQGAGGNCCNAVRTVNQGWAVRNRFRGIAVRTVAVFTVARMDESSLQCQHCQKIAYVIDNTGTIIGMHQTRISKTALIVAKITFWLIL